MRKELIIIILIVTSVIFAGYYFLASLKPSISDEDKNLGTELEGKLDESSEPSDTYTISENFTVDNKDVRDMGVYEYAPFKLNQELTSKLLLAFNTPEIFEDFTVEGTGRIVVAYEENSNATIYEGLGTIIYTNTTGNDQPIPQSERIQQFNLETSEKVARDFISSLGLNTSSYVLIDSQYINYPNS